MFYFGMFALFRVNQLCEHVLSIGNTILLTGMLFVGGKSTASMFLVYFCNDMYDL
jgi:hypothetical protein